ncbi:MAG TPA: preprotein translocase subunit SecG [Candidatus Saccharimonadales bacterium]|nr:preprotein translocase subunit SecG [Candidatus Saccharimonadales bacterium]
MKWAISLIAGFAFIALGWRLSDSRWFSWVLPTFFVVNCLFLIIVVLLQSGKAADIAGAFGGAGSQTAFGPRGAATVLSRATTWCAIMFMVCAMALVLHVDRGVEQGGSVLEKFSKPTPAPVIPARPGTATPQSNAPQSSTPNNAPAPSGQPPAQQKAPASSQPVPAQPAKKP